MLHRVYDNLIPPHIVKEVADLVQAENVYWQWIKSTVGDTDLAYIRPEIAESPQFVHVLHPRTHQGSDRLIFLINRIIQIVVEKSDIDFFHIFRSKANLLVQQRDVDPKCYHSPHCDIITKDLAECFKTKQAVSLIYYPINCDGTTRIFDTMVDVIDESNTTINAIKTANCVAEIEPVAGRCLLFPANLLHASSSPRKSIRRIVFNTVFFSNTQWPPN